MNLWRYATLVRTSLPRVLPLLRDARVPLWLKLGGAAAAVLVISPLDLLGDIPILGIADDIALLGLVAAAFVALATRYLTGSDPGAPPVRVVPARVIRR